MRGVRGHALGWEWMLDVGQPDIGVVERLAIEHDLPVAVEL